MNILLTNDDGISSKGIQSLYRKLKKEGHNVYVSAPDIGYSCSGQAITVNNILRCETRDTDGENQHSVKGYPADCIFIAMHSLYNNIKFDFVISGINNGANVGYDINYSGTLGAAREAFSYGIPTMAVSFFTHNTEADFSVPCDWTVKVLDKLKDNCSADCLYNLNVPYKTSSEIKGLKISPMSQVKYFSGIEENTDPYGRKYYFITGNYNWKLGDSKDADFLLKNYVTLTPIKIDYSDYDEIKRLNNIFFTEKEEN